MFACTVAVAHNGAEVRQEGCHLVVQSNRLQKHFLLLLGTHKVSP